MNVEDADRLTVRLFLETSVRTVDVGGLAPPALGV